MRMSINDDDIGIDVSFNGNKWLVSVIDTKSKKINMVKSFKNAMEGFEWVLAKEYKLLKK